MFDVGLTGGNNETDYNFGMGKAGKEEKEKEEQENALNVYEKMWKG
ncbi:hypothetical protein [Escherichia coli]